jgi:16S rRNA (uracil1498-N3)-methyltransferase
MQLFFQQNITPPLVTLGPEESKHLTRVLRKKQGDKISLTNGQGMLFECVILDANPSKTSLKVMQTIEVPAENFHIHLAIAPTKSPDRMEWMVEKITEIGTVGETPNQARSQISLLQKIIEIKKIPKKTNKILESSFKNSK